MYTPTTNAVVMAELQATAWYRHGGGAYYSFTVSVSIPDWTISGFFNGTLDFNLSKAVSDLTGSEINLPDDLLDFAISNLNFTAAVEQKLFTFHAVVNGTLFGSDVLRLINTNVGLTIDASGSSTTYTGTIDGILALGGIEFSVDATISNDPNTDTTLTIHLVNETVGSMLNHLIHLVDPTYDISLGEPWDKLLDISLDAFVLQITLPPKGSGKGATVSLSYNTSIDLGFIDITAISLTYSKATTAASSVKIELEGTFLGQAFGTGSSNPPLGWDAMNDQPPSVPGKGSKVFDLEYVGLGQHIAFPDPQPATIADVMKRLHDSVVPAQPGQLPEFGGKDGSLMFSQDSNWLIGAQFTVMDTLAISAIFNDPNLYGILIQLSGAKAKIFAGLSFEILYRKVTETIGVYHIELKLPDAMRNLQFGEVAITLPVIILDIYTNGNFRVDFGFPTGLDFSNSFSIQVFPFVGFGGFYFALLDGATSSRVPKITNGNFSPVIEFGVALSLGVGKTFDEGILSGGITLTVIGILQGVLGWFNPTQPAPKEEYFWFQGSISIIGRLYATINFAIISASLDVTAYATVTLTIESHQPIYIALSAGVSVTLSVKILFFTIHLSFSATVHASFTIGSATPTPWVLADGSGASSGSNNALRQPRSPLALTSPGSRSTRALDQVTPGPLAAGSDGPSRQMRGQQTLHSTVVRQAGFVRALRSARIAAVLAETPPLTNWPAMLVLPQIETVTLRLLPSFTKSETDAAAVDAILLLTAENSIDPNAVTLNEHRALFGAAPETAAFNLLMEAMLLWAIQAQTGGQAQVSADDLESLQQQLKNPDTTAAAFDYTTLTNFLAENFVFDVTTTSQWTIAAAARAGNVVTLTTATPHGLAVGDTVSVAGVTDPSFEGQFQLTSASGTTLGYAQQGADADSSGGTVDETGGVTFFPMVPAVGLSDTAGTSVDFSNFNLVDQNYQAKAAAYFQLLQTQFQQRNNGQGNDDESTASAPVSVATVIFAHYFNMLMTAGIKAAIDLLHSYAYTTPDNAQSIGDIAGALDPTLLDEPLRIVAPNQDKAALAQGAMFNLPNVVVQVRSGDTPTSLATSFESQGALSPGGQRYTGSELLAANAGAVGILTPGLLLTFNGLSYTTQTNDTLNMIAVRLLLRLASSSLVNSVVGLGPAVQVLQQSNPGISDPNRPLAAFIAPQNGAARKSGLTTITTLTPHGLTEGDTVTIQGVTDASFNGNVSVVKALTLLSFTYQQTGLPDSAGGSGVAAYPQPIIVPGSNSYTVAPGDSLTMIAVYSLAFAQGLFDVAGFLAQVQQLNSGLPSDPTQPLTAGTMIKFPPLVHVLVAGDSINTLATALLATPGFVQTNLDAVPASTQLLAPQAVLHVPLQYPAKAKAGTNDGDTFSGIAAKFDLTLQEVATQAVNVTGLFAAQQSLTISDLPQISVPTLLAGLLNQAEWNNAAGQVSRFLLSGLRLPDPNDAYFQGLTLADMNNPAKVGPIKTLPLYELTGQQYVLPATNLGAYQITLADQAQVSWLQLNGSGSTTFGLTAGQQNLISAIAASPITPNVQTLTRLALYQMTPPRIALQHHIAWQAATLPGGCLSSGGAAGNPSLWLFPDSLVQQIEQASALNTGRLLYELVAAKHHDPGQPVTAAEANCYAWATIVDFEIALPATGQPTPSVSNAYVVNGADDTGAALLQQVQQYLTQNQRTLNIAANGAVRTGGTTPVTTITTAAAHGLAPGAQVTISGVPDASFNGAFTVAGVPSPTTFTYAQPGQPAATSTGGTVSAPALAELYLLYSPNPASGNPSGLVSDQLSADASYLLKTNLSTLTHSGGGNFAAFATTDPTGIYAARLSDPADFLALLWEASITRSGGFYLSYFNQAGNAALPSSVFGTSSTATLSLLVLLDTQASSKDATTLPFNNCAIVGDNIDTSTTTLFIQPALYTVVANDSLTSATNTFNQVWETSYSVLDVAGFNQGVGLLLQVGASLSIPNQNPYTIGYGDTLASIVKKQLPNGSLQDLVNAGANATSPILAVGAPMQFANGILQPAATVPQGTLGFELTRTAPDPNTDVVDTLFNLIGYSIEAAGPFLQSGAGLPTTPADSWQAQTDGLTQRALHDEVATQWFYHQTLVVNPFAVQPQGSTSAALPAAQNNPYNGIGSGNQLNDVTLKLQLQDIFGNSPAAAALATLPVPVGYFDTLNGLASWPSLAVSYEVSGSNGAPQLALNLTMQQARYIPSASIPVSAAQAAIKADLASYQGIYYQMGQPDVTFALQTSLDTQTSSYPLNKTPFFAFAYGAYVYLAALASMQQVTPTLSGAATVSNLWDQYGVTAAQLFEANQNTLVTKLFAPGALVVPQMYATVQSDSLQSVVNDPEWQFFHLTVPGLAILNKDVPLGAGVDLSATSARTIAATATDSLNAAAQRAHAAVAALAAANANTAGLWREGAVLTVGTKQYTMGVNARLADAAKALNVTVEALGLANQWLTNLFAGNVTLQVNDIAVSDGDTLASLALFVSSDVATLANANATVQNLFAPATEIQIGLEAQPAAPGVADTLASYAASNHVTLAQLGGANLATAFLESAEPLIPGALQQTNAPQFCTYVASSVDTADSIAAKFGTTAATLSSLNLGLPGLLNGNAVVQGSRWVCPPMQGDAHGENNLRTLKGLATAYHILTAGGQPDVATLAQANAASLGLLAAQVPLSQWGLTTSANETFNSLVNRLAAKNVLTSNNTAYTVSDVALALAETANLINPTAVVTPVPPVEINSNGVAITPHFTQAVFPLAVNVTTSRDEKWVDPDFSTVASVLQAVTSIRPEPDQAQASDNNSPFTFNQFANALQAAIEGLFAATGSSPAEGDSPNASTFWAVNLGNAAGPQLGYQFRGDETEYFALPPLSTSLQGGTVNIKPYVSGQTPPLSGPEQAQTFKAVDMDVWLDTFLQGIDLFLSPAYAVPAYALSPDDVTSVITDKKSLAQKLSQLVTWVLQGPQQTSLHDAQAAMQQALLTQLSSAFTVDTLVQVPVTVTSSTTDPLAAPRLSGKVGLAGSASQQLPNAFSFSTAKVALTNGSATATFLFSVKAPASSKDAALDLQYNVTELELPNPHAVIGDYEGSSWLKFLQPLPVQSGPSSSLIGKVDIPIPLRAYPSPLLMVAQTATASYQSPSDTDDLVRWDATTNWAHQDADQDEIALRMEVATADSGALNRTLNTSDTDALFAALAQFIAVWPAVSNDLARLTTRAPGAAPDPIAYGALAAFAMMVDAVTTVWPTALLTKSPRPAADNVAAEIVPGTYEYTLIRQLDGGQYLSTLTVLANAANPATLWPEFAVDDGNGMNPLTLTSSSSSQAIYTYPANVPKGQSLTYSLTLPKLDVVMIPDFELSASVTRNADLVSTPTNSLFIYSTPYTGFPSPLIPLLVFGDDFPIGAGSTQQLEAALAAFLEGLLDRPTTPGTSRTLRVAGSYGYHITQGGGVASAVRGPKSAIAAQKVELVPRLPIVLVPSIELEINGDDNASIAAFAKDLAGFIVEWDGQVKPSHTNASLFFDVCLFSASASSNNKPLLIVSAVQYSLE